jgi:hypothetical protein
MSLFPHLSFAPYFDICKTQQNKNIRNKVVKQEWHLSKKKLKNGQHVNSNHMSTMNWEMIK